MMAWKTFLIASLMAAPAMASQSTVPAQGAPPAGENARYCLKVEAVTGTRLETIECRTRQEWAEWEVDVDQEWAEEGVRVIG